MSDEVLITILLLMIGAQAWTFIWIAGHHKGCHKAPGEAIAALTQRMTTAEEEAERLAQNAHDDRSVISVAVLDLALVMQRLSMTEGRHEGIPEKLRRLADNLDEQGRSPQS